MAEDKKKEIDVAVIEVTEEYLKEKLYKIRGKRVLLDADLAEIYGCLLYTSNDWKLGWEGNDIKRAVGAVIDMIIESIR